MRGEPTHSSESDSRLPPFLFINVRWICWDEHGFFRGTFHIFPSLEGAQNHAVRTSSCPFLGYLAVLQRNVLRFHPPLQARAGSRYKACGELLAQAVFPRGTAQVHLFSLLLTRTEVRRRRCNITHIWGTSAGVTQDARGNLRSVFLSCLHKSRLILGWIALRKCKDRISSHDDKRCVHTTQLSSPRLKVCN